ncbi:MAG: lipid-A-disaccharide synthase [Alphaproteobacteria bacterium]|nr:lipid-A-disaccharide synthase [Alphaproteobacteria bacterium]
MERPRIMLVAGEPSGDQLGAAMMRALRALTQEGVEFAGIGGSAMEREGLHSLVPLADLAVMGLAEVVPRLPTILRHLRRACDFALAWHPDALVTIDAPGFNLRLARRIGRGSFPLIHCVAPSVWAWRPGRAQKMAVLFDHLLTLLPFEPPYFERVGLPATFIGHPLLERPQPGDGPAFRRRLGITAEETVVGVLPGSRRSETSRLLAPFGQTVARLARERPLTVVLPSVSPVEADVRQAVASWPLRTVVVVEESEKADAFDAFDVAMAASGTVALELARASVPSIVAYRLNPLTHAIVHRLIHARFANLVNVVLDRMVVPEFLQGDCTPKKLYDALRALLDNPDEGEKQVAAAREALGALVPGGGRPPSEIAATKVLELIANRVATRRN